MRIVMSALAAVLVSTFALQSPPCRAPVTWRGAPRPSSVQRVLVPPKCLVAPGGMGNKDSASAAVEAVPVPPPNAAALIVLLLCCSIGAVCSLDRVLISIAIIPMSSEMLYSDATKGAIAAGFSVGYCLGLAPAGIASSQYSPKVVLLAGLLVWSAAQAATPMAAATSLPALLAARILMGIGEAAAVPSLQVIAARFVPAERRSLFWGILSAALSCGTIAAYVVSPPLIESHGWPYVFELFGAAGGALALVWALLGADEPQRAAAAAAAAAEAEAAEGTGGIGTLVAAASPPASAAASRAEPSPVPWDQIRVSRPVWALAAAHSSVNFFMYFGLSWLPTYFAYQFGMSTADASAASLYPFVAGAVGSLVAGASCDQLVDRGLSLTDARKLMGSLAMGGPLLAMLVLALLSAGVGGVLLSRDEAEALFIGAVGMSAFAAAGYGCGAQDISARLASLLYGATSVFAVIAGASGQYFTGWLLDHYGRDFTPIFVLVVLIEAAGLVAWNRWWCSDRIFD
jgi:ACS family sodium-dependent inorganic phosphate cotransporter